jgi:IMP cyclohydrolase
MYVGRFVALARTPAGQNAVLYRVSSRSFPNREAIRLEDRIAIMPSKGHEGDLLRSPYISYACLRLAGDCAVATNGTHTDPIAEKIAAGVPVRDAIATALLALDYERDAYNTPRIAAVVPRSGDRGWLATVRRDALIVIEVPLVAGRACYVATYEADDPRADRTVAFQAADAPGAAAAAIAGPGFADLERPVTSAAAVAGPDGFAVAVATPDGSSGR